MCTISNCLQEYFQQKKKNQKIISVRTVQSKPNFKTSMVLLVFSDLLLYDKKTSQKFIDSYRYERIVTSYVHYVTSKIHQVNHVIRLQKEYNIRDKSISKQTKKFIEFVHFIINFLTCRKVLEEHIYKAVIFIGMFHKHVSISILNNLCDSSNCRVTN